MNEDYTSTLTDGLFDIDIEEAKEEAAKEFQLPPIKGAYVGTIKEVIYDVSPSGAKSIQFAMDINGFNYRFAKEYIQASDKKENKNIGFYNIFVRSLAITGILDNGKPKIKEIPAKVYDFDEQKVVEKPVPQFVQLLNKEIGVVVTSEPAFKRVVIDGYTKEQQPNAISPQHIYFEDFNNQVGIDYRILNFFNAKTKQTYSEMRDKKEPKAIDLAVESLMKKEFKKPNLQDMDKMCKRQLMNSLKSKGADFFENEYISFVETGGIVMFDDMGSGETHENVSDDSVPF